MSHIERGPLTTYNSLADNHLNGYFSNTRMRRHLRKAGLVTKYGEIVSENTYRLNMSRKEHKKHVKDMLAQAIVHKTLDLERSRQAEIKKKLEEIAKIELVRRVRASRQRKRDDDVLPYISPRSGSSRTGSASASSSKKGSSKRRPASTPARKGRRPISALSSNYEDDDEEVVYLDDEGRPITPAHVDNSDLHYTSKDPIDTRHLYALDTSALRKYAILMARMEQGRGVTSPYLIPQVPIPPKSPHSGRSPRSAHRYRSNGEVSSKSSSPKRPATAGPAYLHPAGSPKKHMCQPESNCEVLMRYHGSSLSLAREQFDRRQDIVIEQQHCGGNTLTVFKDKLEPDTKFSFISYRHRGYPFSLSIYIDGKMDCRVSTCCEDRHKKGGRIGGKHGHFSFLRINGARPCYRCQVEKGVRIGNQAPKRKLKRPPTHMEEVVVVETEQEPQREVEEKEEEEDKYEDDFDESSSSSESDRDEGGLNGFTPKDARAVDKTKGQVDIHDTSDSDSDNDGKQQYTLSPTKKATKSSPRTKTRAPSSSSSSSSDNEDTYEARKSDIPPPPLSVSASVKEDTVESPKDKKTDTSAQSEQTEARPDYFASFRFASARNTEIAEETPEITREEDAKPRSDGRRDSMSSQSSRSSHNSSKDYSDSYNEGYKEEENKSAEVTQKKEEEEKSEEAIGSYRGERVVPQVVVAEVDDVPEWSEAERFESRDITSSRVDDDKDLYFGAQGGDVSTVAVEQEEEEKKREEEREEKSMALAVGAVAASNIAEVNDQEATATASQPEPQQEAVPPSTTVQLSESPQHGQQTSQAGPHVAVPPPDAGTRHTPEPTKSPPVETAEGSPQKASNNDDDNESSSSSSSDSSSDESSSDEEETERKSKVETQAVVHQTETQTAPEDKRKVSESDGENRDGGNDPDNVTSSNGSAAANIKIFAEVGESKPQDGSILPLLEASPSTLEVKGVTLNKTQVYETAEFLESAKEIRFFNLVNCGIDDDDVQKLTEAMKVSPSNPVLVNLSLNPLTAGCVPHLLNMLKSKPCIEAIVLQGTRLGDDGVCSLVDGLLALHQERKMATQEGQEKEKELNELDLSDTKFGDEGIAAVSRLVRSDMDIDTLTLSYNHAVNTDGWCMLGEALSRNVKLETLTLDHNFIEDSGLEAIAQGLHNNTMLTALDLNHVGITEKSGKTLLELLKRNTTIREITMAGNNIPEAEVENIQVYIALNKSYS